MPTIFVICAVLGGTILICQFVLTLLGMGHGLDVGGDMHDLSGDVHDIGADASHDGVDHPGEQGHSNHASSWLFGVISFRTLVAAFAFFGLAGLAADSAKFTPVPQVAIALVSGIAAMYGVHFAMRQLGRMGQDSTVRISRALGLPATVYVPIPAAKSGRGKVQLTLQNRLVEYEAITSSETKLATGDKVRVAAIRGSTLEVEPIESEPVAAKV